MQESVWSYSYVHCKKLLSKRQLKSKPSPKARSLQKHLGPLGPRSKADKAEKLEAHRLLGSGSEEGVNPKTGEKVQTLRSSIQELPEANVLCLAAAGKLLPQKR